MCYLEASCSSGSFFYGKPPLNKNRLTSFKGNTIKDSRSNQNLELVVFVKGVQTAQPEKHPRIKNENQQQIQPTYDSRVQDQTPCHISGRQTLASRVSAITIAQGLSPITRPVGKNLSLSLSLLFGGPI